MPPAKSRPSKVLNAKQIAALTLSQLAAEVELAYATLHRKKSMGWTNQQIYDQYLQRKAAREAGVRIPGDKGAAQHGIPKAELVKNRSARKEAGKVYKQARKQLGTEKARELADAVRNGGAVPVLAAPANDATGDGGETLFSAQLRKERALADKNELEVKIKRQELADVDDLKAWFGSCVIRAKEVIMNLPNLVDHVRHAADEVSARKIMEDECRRALSELGNYAQKLATKAK